MPMNRMQFVEYVGSDPNFSLNYSGHKYEFKPNPTFAGRRVEFIVLGFAETVCEKDRNLKLFDPNDVEYAEQAFKEYVLSRKDEVMEWLTEPKVKYRKLAEA